MDDFSVIIRVKNEERYLGHAIQSVLDLLYKPEIIIVDNESTDMSSNIWGLFRQDSKLNSEDSRYAPFKEYKISNYTPGKALNLGVRNATRTNILILSSHCVLKKFDVKEITEKLETYPCIFGHQTPYYYGKRISSNYIWSHFIEKETENMYSELEKRYFLHNALCIYKRQLLLDIPFSEELIGKEDRYWAAEYTQKGGKYLYTPQIRAEHHYTDKGNTWKGIG